MMGNKGGVGIRMDINNSSIAFICCHFAAHREKVAEEMLIIEGSSISCS